LKYSASLYIFCIKLLVFFIARSITAKDSPVLILEKVGVDKVQVHI